MGRIPLWRRYARMFGPDPAADIQDELRFHIDAKVDDLVALGWSRDAARAEAKRQFGDIRAVRQAGERLGKERERTVERRDYWSGIVQDFRYALRTLRKDRGFAIVTVLILALGIAANTAVFSVVNTVLLRPLPFPDAHQLTWLTSGQRSVAAGRDPGGLSGVTYTVAAYEEFQRQNHSFQQITSYNPFLGNGEFTLTGRGEPQSVAAVMVAGNFFQTLGVTPAMGRLFAAEECQKGGRPAVLLSYPFWQRQFGGDPGIIGQEITMSKQAVTVVGVLPAAFDFGSVFAPGTKIDAYVPAVMDEIRNWGNTLAIIGRLKSGVSVRQGQAEADILFPQIMAAHKDWWGDYTSTVVGLKDFVSGKLRRSLIVLWCAVGLILLIVCVNLSNLMLARAAARSKEFAIRGALGAGRGRLLRQLLTESLVLSTAGAVLGVALAFALTRYLAHQGSFALPLLSDVAVDGTALLWTLLITVTVAIAFGLVPAFHLSNDLQSGLKDSGHGNSAGRKHERLRSMMVISEVALAFVLLVGAGLLLRSFLHVLDVDLGFTPSRAAVIKVDYEGVSNAERRGAVLQEMMRNIEAIPGIEAAGITDMLPLGRNRSWGLEAVGMAYPKEQNLSALVRIVTPGYLKAMGMHLKAGRDFTWEDTPKSAPVVIINEAAARQFWQGEDPLRHPARTNGRDTQVIGIIADVRAHSLEEAAAGPEMFLPVTQVDPEGAELVVRTKLPPETLGRSVMQTLRSLNPAQPSAEFRPLQQIVDRAVSPRRFFVLLVGAFAGLGLILASLGIYGVMSYSVTRQTQEIGIRMALGATTPQVQMRVMLRAMRLAGAGILIGAAGSLAAAKWIESLLFGTKATDVPTFVVIALILATAAIIAGYIPARRASRIDPMVALRTN